MDRIVDIFEIIKNVEKSLGTKEKIITIILDGKGGVGGREGKHI